MVKELLLAVGVRNPGLKKRFSEHGFQCLHPSAQARSVARQSHKKVDMVRHDDEAPDSHRVIGVCALRKGNKRREDPSVGEHLHAPMRVEREEIERTHGGKQLEPGRTIGKSTGSSHGRTGIAEGLPGDQGNSAGKPKHCRTTAPGFSHVTPLPCRPDGRNLDQKPQACNAARSCVFFPHEIPLPSSL